MRILADPDTRSVTIDRLAVRDGKVEPLFVVRGTDEHFKATVGAYFQLARHHFPEASLDQLTNLIMDAGAWPKHEANGKVERIDMAADRAPFDPKLTLDGILIGMAIKELKALKCSKPDLIHKLESCLKIIPKEVLDPTLTPDAFTAPAPAVSGTHEGEVEHEDEGAASAGNQGASGPEGAGRSGRSRGDAGGGNRKAGKRNGGPGKGRKPSAHRAGR